MNVQCFNSANLKAATVKDVSFLWFVAKDLVFLATLIQFVEPIGKIKGTFCNLKKKKGHTHPKWK